MKQVILIDGKNLCYRHGWTHRELRWHGVPTGMLYGCITGVARLARLHPDTAIAFCWDGKNSMKSWRHRLSPEYKANRKLVEPKTKADADKIAWKKAMEIQIPLFKEFIDLMGFKQLEVATLEADDLIGILSTHLKPIADRILIYSGDRDFYQLMSKRVKVVHDRDKTKKCKPVSRKDIKKEFGIYPKDWLKYRAIVGDKGDHIIKVKGMGPKTALKLLAEGLDATKNTGNMFEEGYEPKGKPIADKDWRVLRLNYKLSRILKNPNDLALSKAEQYQLYNFLHKVSSASELKRKKERGDYHKMEQFLAKYGLSDLMARRKELWELA
jgi:DNA polymerase-1